MDKVYIRGLEVETIIGVHAWERDLLRPLIFFIEMGTDMRDAAASDSMRDAIDYDGASQLVRKIALELKPALLEKLAEHIARALFAAYPIQTLRLGITKPGAVTGVHDVGVEIERKREDYVGCGI